MSQHNINLFLSLVGGAILSIMSWLLIEVNDQGKQAAAFAEAGRNMEMGFDLLIKQIDKNRVGVSLNAAQIGRNSDKIERNERDIEKLSQELRHEQE